MSFTFRFRALAIAFVSGALFAVSCSQPVLEPESCIAARDSVKRLYSLYLDTEVGSKDQRLAVVRNLLSQRLFDELSQQQAVEIDYMTQSKDMPKAARVGACNAANGETRFEVLLFWRKDEVNIETRVLATLKNQNGWVTDRVTKSN